MDETFQIDDLLLRRANFEDLETFDEIASSVHFDIGLHNWKLYYSINPKEFWVMVEPKEKKIVGIWSGNRVNDDLFWGHHVVILPEYRHKSRFRRTIELIQSAPYFAGNRNANSIYALRQEPTHFGYKLVGFYGRINHQKHWEVKPPKNITLITLSNDMTKVDKKHLTSLYKYDEALYENIPAPKRRYWLNEWLFPEDPNHSIAVVAWNETQSSVVGYGVGRFQTKAFSSMSPVYADSDEIAYAIFCELGNHLKDRENLYMEFQATRRICFQFVHEAGLLQTYSNFRVYCPFVYDFPVEKQYCDQEFWPL